MIDPSQMAGPDAGVEVIPPVKLEQGLVITKVTDAVSWFESVINKKYAPGHKLLMKLVVAPLLH